MNEWKQGAEAVVVTGWDKRSGTQRGVPGPSLHSRRAAEAALPPGRGTAGPIPLLPRGDLLFSLIPEALTATSFLFGGDGGLVLSIWTHIPVRYWKFSCVVSLIVSSLCSFLSFWCYDFFDVRSPGPIV